MSTPENQNPNFDEATTPDTEPHKEAPEALGKSDIEAFAAQMPTGANGKRKKKTPKKRRGLLPILASLGGVAVLAGAIWLFTYVLKPAEAEPTPEPPDTSVTLLDKELNADGTKMDTPIKSVHITSLLDEYTLALNSDGVLALAGEASLPVNQTNIDELVNALVRIEAEDTIATGVSSMTDYGLDTPTVTVEVTYQDDLKVRLELAEMAVGNHYYLRMDGGDSVYLLSSDLPTQVLQKEEAFVGLTMIATPAVGSSDVNGSVVLKELSLTGTVRNNQITTIRRKETTDSGEFANSTYLLTEPYLADTDSTVVTNVFGVTGVSASEVTALHPTAEQLAEYGLETPASIAKIVLAVYTYTTDDSGTVNTSGYYNETQHLMLLGNKDEDGNYYAMVDTLDVVYLVSPDNVLWAEKTYQDFANQYLFLRNLNTLSSISCTLDGKTHEFTFAHHPEEAQLDDQLTVTMDGTVYPTDMFRELYQVLMTLYRTGPAPAEPTGDPLLTVRVTSLDTSYSVKEVKIYPYSGSVYIARSENGDTYKMSASRVDDAIQQIKNYLNGDTVVNKF